jgi:hypothetical protein
LLGSGAGFVAHRTAAGQPGAKPAPAADRPPSVAQTTKDKTDKEKPREAALAPKPKVDEVAADSGVDAVTRLKNWREQLTKPLNFEGITNPAVTLQEALDKLGKRFNINFEINDAAFAREQLRDVGQTPLAEGKPIPPMRNASLATLLRIILARVPSETGAVYILRPDSVEITTTAALLQELGIARNYSPAGAPPVIPLVWDVFEETPISKALMRVTEQTSFNVIVDASVKDKVKLNVTAQFNNVPVDTAVRLLANMADLSIVKLDNVFYLTTSEKAKRLREEHLRELRGPGE